MPYPMLPSVRALVVVAGVAVLLVAGWSIVRYLQAPAAAPPAALPDGHIAAAADHVAVLDGETLRLGDQVVQLAGIVAPARGSVCRDSGLTPVDCGSAAANALASLVRGRTVACAIDGGGRWGHPLGDCTAGGVDLGRAVVLDGWARATTAALREAESDARAAGRGIWHTGS